MQQEISTHSTNLDQEYVITEAQLIRLFEWPGCEEEAIIAATIRRRKITRMDKGNLLVDKLPDVLDVVLDDLEYLPSWKDSHGIVWVILSHVQELIADKKKSQIYNKNGVKVNPSIEQALNEGDGVYRP